MRHPGEGEFVPKLIVDSAAITDDQCAHLFPFWIFEMRINEVADVPARCFDDTRRKAPLIAEDLDLISTFDKRGRGDSLSSHLASVVELARISVVARQSKFRCDRHSLTQMEITRLHYCQAKDSFGGFGGSISRLGLFNVQVEPLPIFVMLDFPDQSSCEFDFLPFRKMGDVRWETPREE